MEGPIREYSAMALLGVFVIMMTTLIGWSARRIVTRAMDSFDKIVVTLQVVEKSMSAMKEAIDETTTQIIEHRREAQLHVERLSREGRRK